MQSAFNPHILRTPSWLRILQIIIGAISIILSGYVLVIPGFQILSIVLLLVGIESTAVGAFSHYLRTSTSRLSNIAFGSLAIAFSILLIALLPSPPILIAISLGGVSLLFNGVARIIQGVGAQDISRWTRALLIAVGVLTIAISGVIIAHPIGFGVPLLARVMSFALLVIGIGMTAMGAVGIFIVANPPTRKKS